MAKEQVSPRLLKARQRLYGRVRKYFEKHINKDLRYDVVMGMTLDEFAMCESKIRQIIKEQGKYKP